MSSDLHLNTIGRGSGDMAQWSACFITMGIFGVGIPALICQVWFPVNNSNSMDKGSDMFWLPHRGVHTHTCKDIHADMSK